MPDLTFTRYARQRMQKRRVPVAAVYHVVADADEVIERDDERTEYIGAWEGQTLLVVTEGEDEPLTVVNVIREPRWD